MRTRCGIGVVAVLVVAVATPIVVAGGAELTPQNKLLAKRAAQVDALRKLAEQVYGLKIDARTTVRDFVTESDVIKTEVKAFLRGAKQVGEPRYAADGICEVDYEMTLETIITELKRIADGYVSKSGKFTGKVFEQIRQNTQLTTIRVTGSGAPRTAAEDVLPAGSVVEEGLAFGLVPVATVTVPPGWEGLGNGRLMAMNAAKNDAYRQVAEQVYGLRIDAQTTVKDFVTQSDEIAVQVKAFIQGAKPVAQRYGSDLIAECDVQMTLEDVITNLKRVADGYVKDGKFKGQVFEQIKQHSVISTISVTGFGTLAATEAMLARIKYPMGWEAVTPQGRLMAMRGAQVDAYRLLGEQVIGLRIDAQTTVRDFVTESDDIRSSLEGFIRGIKVTGRRYMCDQIAECDAQVTLEEVVTTLKRICDGVVKGGKFKGQTFEQITKNVTYKTVKVTGHGVSPEKYMRNVSTPLVAPTVAAPDVPEWATKVLKATGTGVVDQAELKENPAQAWLKAETAGKVDGQRKLAEQVSGIQIDAKTLVKDFVAQHDEIKAVLDTFMRGFRVVATRHNEDGTAEVDVELPLDRLWKIFSTK